LLPELGHLGRRDAEQKCEEKGDAADDHPTSGGPSTPSAIRGAQTDAKT
jgi:hypothetical protein